MLFKLRKNTETIQYLIMSSSVIGDISASKTNHKLLFNMKMFVQNIYLRNKETQQTLWVIVGIQHDARF